MQSVESFISNIDARSLSMEETEYENNMEFARALLTGLSADSDCHSNQIDHHAGHVPRVESAETRHNALNASKDPALPRKLSNPKFRPKETSHEKDHLTLTKVSSLSDLENKGASLLLKEDKMSQVFQEYPFLFACIGDLTINDVEDLLNVI